MLPFMAPEPSTVSPEANYLTRTNIVPPYRSQDGYVNEVGPVHLAQTTPGLAFEGDVVDEDGNEKPEGQVTVRDIAAQREVRYDPPQLSANRSVVPASALEDADEDNPGATRQADADELPQPSGPDAPPVENERPVEDERTADDDRY